MFLGSIVIYLRRRYSVIRIDTSSHYLAKERNKKAFYELNNLLLGEKNPYQELFQTEKLFLDDTDGFISIVPSCKDAFYSKDSPITYGDLEKLADFIWSNIEFYGTLYIFIGDYVFKY